MAFLSVEPLMTIAPISPDLQLFPNGKLDIGGAEK
jgi:hypothetical protein